MVEVLTAGFALGFSMFLATGGANERVFRRFFARSTEAQYQMYRNHPSFVFWRRTDRERHVRSTRRNMLLGGAFGVVVSGAWLVTVVLDSL